MNFQVDKNGARLLTYSLPLVERTINHVCVCVDAQQKVPTIEKDVARDKQTHQTLIYWASNYSIANEWHTHQWPIDVCCFNVRLLFFRSRHS